MENIGDSRLPIMGPVPLTGTDHVLILVRGFGYTIGSFLMILILVRSIFFLAMILSAAKDAGSGVSLNHKAEDDWSLDPTYELRC